jgi:hypothetical protein
VGAFLPVFQGVVRQFKQDEALAFVSAQVQPYARIAYGRQFLLLDVIKEKASPAVTAALPSIASKAEIKPEAVKP